MLVIAAAAVTAGSITVAVIAPLNLLLAIALGPLAGTGAAVFAALLVAGRRREDEREGAESDTDADKMVPALRGMGRQGAAPAASPGQARPARFVGRT
jgi:hypothetical protein